MMKARTALVVGFVPFLALAFDWPIEPSAVVKEKLLSYLTAEASTNLAVCAKFVALKPKVAEAKGISWMPVAYDAGLALLKTCEGADVHDVKRRAALKLIDYPLHIDNYNTNDLARADLEIFYQTVSDAFVAARKRVLAEVRAAKVPEGSLRIWRIYNAGFVVKGPRHTVIFDLTDCPGEPKQIPGPWTKPGSLARYEAADYAAFADLADVLFMTHDDGDHYAVGMFKAMAERGKPIVLPCPPVWWDRRVCELADTVPTANFVILPSHNFAGREIGGVTVRNVFGSQGRNTPCNVYHVTIDGIAVVHNGDNDAHEKVKLLAKCPPAKVILGTTWNAIRLLMAGVASAPGFDYKCALLVPGHENEMSHAVNHRESYWELYARPDRFGPPSFTWPTIKPVHWGESASFQLPH